MKNRDLESLDRRPIASLFRATAGGATRFCVDRNIHPDPVSYASVVAALGAAVCFVFSGSAHWLLPPATALCVLRLWCNMLDGMVAIAAGRTSRRGEIINELPDRISDVQQQFFDRLSSTDKTIKQYPGMYHDVLHEKDRDQPLPIYHPKQLNFSATRTVIGSLGKLSDGMRLGWSDGFKSGRMLDYVYENRPQGITPLGKLADKIYLNSPGWTGIRVRRNYLDELLDTAIESTTPAPDITIVSGLFELFPENDVVLNTLRGIARALGTGGQLIYTNQPWHPQQELIARSLHGFDGKLWAMRCRSTAEMDQLVSLAGFQKRQMRIDDNGIFTVSLATRIESSDD